MDSLGLAVADVTITAAGHFSGLLNCHYYKK